MLYYGLTVIGIVHTLISLFALVAGIVLLVRNGFIRPDSTLGKWYIVTTVIVCISGFFIFQHGGFGKPHALGIITLAVIALAMIANRSEKFLGIKSIYVVTVCYSSTLFFHLVPAITETLTRLPLDHPLAASPDDPIVKGPTGVAFLLYLIGVVVQVRRLRAAKSA